jgi:hypothetical protein
VAQASQVRSTLEHLGLPTETPNMHQARGPGKANYGRGKAIPMSTKADVDAASQAGKFKFLAMSSTNR